MTKGTRPARATIALVPLRSASPLSHCVHRRHDPRKPAEARYRRAGCRDAVASAAVTAPPPQHRTPQIRHRLQRPDQPAVTPFHHKPPGRAGTDDAGWGGTASVATAQGWNGYRAMLPCLWNGTSARAGCCRRWNYRECSTAATATPSRHRYAGNGLNADQEQRRKLP